MIEKKQVYGLATPEDFTLPPHHPLWTPEAYAAFEVSAQASEKYDTKVGISYAILLSSDAGRGTCVKCYVLGWVGLLQYIAVETMIIVTACLI